MQIKTASKKNKSIPEIFIYDQLPQKLKIQILRIWDKFYNNVHEQYLNEFYNIKEILCDEYGEIELVKNSKSFTVYSEVCIFFEKNQNTDQCLDVIQLIFDDISKFPNSEIYGDPEYYPKEAIQDLNTRFLENGVGYEFRDGEIIRIDNKLLHQEIIINALYFLSTSEFQNANDEYLTAHEHFRYGRTKECLNDCLKALETTLKIICGLNSWTYNQKDSASALIKIVIDNKLIPDFLLQHFSSLRSSLESGVPTFRNRLGGHGQGNIKIEVPRHYASYMLYLTGATINFLVSCHIELKTNT